jgi:D-alanine-D-alanine ligase
MNIVIFYGGKSGEHEVSLRSAAAVARNIDSTKYTISLVGITKDGKWYLQSESELERIKKDSESGFAIEEDASMAVSVIPGGGVEGAFFAAGRTIRCDVAFPVLHGTYGEDGTIQGLFDMAGVPYVGCATMSSAITMDKEKTKAIWRQAGLPVVPYICLERSDLANQAQLEEILSKAAETLKYPLFVKPCCAGSSDGASKASNRAELDEALRDAFLWDDKVLIEKAISAREIECSVTGNSVTADGKSSASNIRAYIPGEIAPSHTFYDYDAKYNDPDGANLLIPAAVEQDVLENVREIAMKAYMAVDASGLSRVDFFLDRENGSLYLNEINTMPGFTKISMFPKLCQAAGTSYPELLDILIDEALERAKYKNALKTSR